VITYYRTYIAIEKLDIHYIEKKLLNIIYAASQMRYPQHSISIEKLTKEYHIGLSFNGLTNRLSKMKQKGMVKSCRKLELTPEYKIFLNEIINQTVNVNQMVNVEPEKVNQMVNKHSSNGERGINQMVNKNTSNEMKQNKSDEHTTDAIINRIHVAEANMLGYTTPTDFTDGKNTESVGVLRKDSPAVDHFENLKKEILQTPVIIKGRYV